MTKRRLSKQAKRIAIAKTLRSTPEPLSAYGVGAVLGYANGTPIREVLNEMVEDGLLEAYVETYRDGMDVTYYYDPITTTELARINE